MILPEPSNLGRNTSVPSIAWEERHQKTSITKIMGDKSPKSKQKDKKQKQGKEAASEKEKQQAIAKQQQKIAPPAKKKK